MPNTTPLICAAVFCVAIASPAWAQSSDASADSTRGNDTTKTNKSNLSTKTGVDTGSTAVTSAAPKAAAGSGDSPVLNASGEKVPGSTGTSRPSNLNGQ